MAIAIRAENISKAYQLGEIGTGTISRDLERWISKIRGKEDPFLRIGETNDRTSKGNSNIVWSLKNLNFEIEQGDAVGIIGRNGAGKSTLLKILSRVTGPTTGRITGRGRIASLLEVGTGFHPELTGRENVYLNGSILGMRKREIARKFDEIVDFAGIERYIDTPVKRYSSGMYVRLAFAVAAHLESEILIVDEVLAVGDAEFQKKCLGKMDDVSKGEGRTVLFVSHNMPTIQSLCRDVIWLQHGSIQYSGAFDKVVSHYLSGGLDFSQAEVYLSHHPRRSHSLESSLKKVWILDSLGNKNNLILMGQPMVIGFEFDCSRDISNPGFGFGIEDEYGRRIFSLNNYMIGYIKKSARRGICCFNIPSIQLIPGTYFVSISIVEAQIKWIDFVEQAITIEIQPNDIYKTGKIPERSQGVIYIQDGTILINDISSN